MSGRETARCRAIVIYSASNKYHQEKKQGKKKQGREENQRKTRILSRLDKRVVEASPRNKRKVTQAKIHNNKIHNKIHNKYIMQ